MTETKPQPAIDLAPHEYRVVGRAPLLAISHRGGFLISGLAAILAVVVAVVYFFTATSPAFGKPFFWGLLIGSGISQGMTACLFSIDKPYVAKRTALTLFLFGCTALIVFGYQIAIRPNTMDFVLSVLLGGLAMFALVFSLLLDEHRTWLDTGRLN